MNKRKITYFIFKILLGILAISFGIFMVVFGELDDSPGGQLLGLVVAIAGVWSIIKSRKKFLIR